MTTPPRPIYQFVKRVLDLIYVLLLLPILGPVMLIVWILVRINMGKPAVFQQVRPGRDARPFTLHKFRSMIDANDAEGNPLPDKDRLTPFGRLLRRSSLDELPQLWNVLKGDMSFVGPRPLLMEYVPHYSATQRRRMDVRPGITGLAQIAGRNTLGWEERLGLDVQYVDRASVLLDHQILIRTVMKVVRSEGVPATGLDPNQKFKGTPPASPEPAAEAGSPAPEVGREQP